MAGPAPTDAVEVRSELGSAFRAAWSRYKQEITERAAGYGLSGLQARALRQLDAPLTMSQLASVLRAEPSNLTPIVDRLEASGLVERRPIAGDRRVRELSLTPEGRQIRSALIDEVRGAPSVFDRLTEREHRELLRMLRKLASTDR